MERNLVRLEFYETYYYANIINNIIGDPFPYIRGIHEWYEDAEEYVFLPPFPKVSRLHGFAVHIIDSLISETISDIEIDSLVQHPEHEVWVDRALKYHGFQCDGFRKWLAVQNVSHEDLNEDHLYDYHQELMLAGELETLVEHLSNEVFHVLFANRKLLANFNEFMSRALQLFFDEVPNTELGSHLKAPGVLKRVNIPSWVKRAVFFRDRGLCSLCQKDLSGLVAAQTDPQYDHIIPLAMGGLNDVTNIQLLCKPCNSAKTSDIVPVSSIYESWY
jgi:HNH endonuclease